VPVDPLLRECLGLTRTWATLSDADLRPDHMLLQRILALGPNVLIDKLDLAVSHYQLEAEREMAFLRSIEGLVLAATLLLLILEAFLLFRPASRVLAAKIAEIHGSRNFLESIINGLPDGILVKDVNHKWRLVNELFCRLLGKDRSELIGFSDIDLLPEPVARRFWASDDQVGRTGNFEESEVIFPTRAGVSVCF